jgi:hypothetical protein
MSGAHDLEATSFASPVMPAITPERLELTLLPGAAAGLPARPPSA